MCRILSVLFMHLFYLSSSIHAFLAYTLNPSNSGQDWTTRSHIGQVEELNSIFIVSQPTSRCTLSVGWLLIIIIITIIIPPPKKKNCFRFTCFWLDLPVTCCTTSTRSTWWTYSTRQWQISPSSQWARLKASSLGLSEHTRYF